MTAASLGPRAAMAVAVAVARRPSLWVTAVRQWRRTTAAGWWRRPPFLPLPSRAYMRFRLETQYGAPNARVVPDDVLNYFAWCKRHERLMR